MFPAGNGDGGFNEVNGAAMLGCMDVSSPHHRNTVQSMPPLQQSSQSRRISGGSGCGGDQRPYSEILRSATVPLDTSLNSSEHFNAGKSAGSGKGTGTGKGTSSTTTTSTPIYLKHISLPGDGGGGSQSSGNGGGVIPTSPPPTKPPPRLVPQVSLQEHRGKRKYKFMQKPCYSCDDASGDILSQSLTSLPSSSTGGGGAINLNILRSRSKSGVGGSPFFLPSSNSFDSPLSTYKQQQQQAGDWDGEDYRGEHDDDGASSIFSDRSTTSSNNPGETYLAKTIRESPRFDFPPSKIHSVQESPRRKMSGGAAAGPGGKTRSASTPVSVEQLSRLSACFSVHDRCSSETEVDADNFRERSRNHVAADEKSKWSE